MDFLLSGRLKELYDFMIENPEFEGLDHRVPLPYNYRQYGHPEPFYPIVAICEFMVNDGPALWELGVERNDAAYVKQWIKKGGDITIRHPVTGNTIAHDNYSLFLSLDLPNALEILFMTNYNDIEAHVYNEFEYMREIRD